jgi:hypothetical protein
MTGAYPVILMASPFCEILPDTGYVSCQGKVAEFYDADPAQRMASLPGLLIFSAY